MKLSVLIAAAGLNCVVLNLTIPTMAQEAIPRDSPESVLNHVRQLQQALNLNQQQANKVSEIFRDTVLKENELFKQLEQINRGRESEIEKILNTEQLEQLRKNGLPGILGTHDARDYGRSRRTVQRTGKAGMSPAGSVSSMMGVSSDQLEELGRLILEEKANANQALDRVLSPQQKTMLKRVRAGGAGTFNTGKGKNTQRPSGSGVGEDSGNDAGSDSGDKPMTRDTGNKKTKSKKN